MILEMCGKQSASQKKKKKIIYIYIYIFRQQMACLDPLGKESTSMIVTMTTDAFVSGMVALGFDETPVRSDTGSYQATV